MDLPGVAASDGLPGGGAAADGGRKPLRQLRNRPAGYLVRNEAPPMTIPGFPERQNGHSAPPALLRGATGWRVDRYRCSVGVRRWPTEARRTAMLCLWPILGFRCQEKLHTDLRP